MTVPCGRLPTFDEFIADFLPERFPKNEPDSHSESSGYPDTAFECDRRPRSFCDNVVRECHAALPRAADDCQNDPPLLGGSPAVWNTCQVFFQGVLLVGYTYAHVSTGWMGVRKQGWWHMGIMLIPLAVLPLSLRNWEPPNGDPIQWLWWIFLLLSVSVGLPFFILSTTAPLMQRWFTETGHPSARDPYFLYAASNVGSMLALLGYPSLVEPNIPVKGDGHTWVTQVNLWAIGYCVLLALLAACRLVVALSKPVDAAGADGLARKEKAAIPDATETVRISLWTRLRWIALAFVPSSLMLGVTTYLTLDIAAIPLLWVIPLSIYLLSFILVFAPGRQPYTTYLSLSCRW